MREAGTVGKYPCPKPFGFLLILADDRDVLSRDDVVAGNQVVLGLNVEAFGEFIGAGEAVASAHGKKYSAVHPFIDDLKRNDFVASVAFAEEEACAPTFTLDITAACQPLVEFTTKALGLKPGRCPTAYSPASRSNLRVRARLTQTV